MKYMAYSNLFKRIDNVPVGTKKEVDQCGIQDSPPRRW